MESWLQDLKPRPIATALLEYCTQYIIPCVACKYALPEEYSKGVFHWQHPNLRFDEHSRYNKVAFVGLKPTCNPFGSGHFDNTFKSMWNIMKGSLVLDWIACRGPSGSENVCDSNETKNCLVHLKKRLQIIEAKALVLFELSGKSVKKWLTQYWPEAEDQYIIASCPHPSRVLKKQEKVDKIKAIRTRWINQGIFG